MNTQPSDYLSLLPPAEIQKAGLPFWLFYLLLSVIVLLIIFNFLKNKSLRQRLSYTLAGPRRRFNRLRLQVQMRKEEQKKAELFRRLGELTSSKWPDLPEIEEIASEIRSLEEKNTALQNRWHILYRELELLKLEKQKLSANSNPRERAKEEQEKVDRRIAELEKEKAEIQRNIMATEELLSPHLETIGRVIYRLRPDREDLDFIYFQIDDLGRSIQEIKEKIENL